jgi:hypothetical protein
MMMQNANPAWTQGFFARFSTPTSLTFVCADIEQLSISHARSP